MNLIRTSSQLSFLNQRQFLNNDFESLDYWQGKFLLSNNLAVERNPELDFLYDVYFKILCRGVGTFPSYDTESTIIELYGSGLVKDNKNEKSITYDTADEILHKYNNFSDFTERWDGDIKKIDFDPQHPENERLVFSKLLEKFGTKIVAYIFPQALIETILPTESSADFVGQRVDFLLMFPNGKAFVIEPGGSEHNDPQQIILDKQRDGEFLKIGIRTLRPNNDEIHNDEFYAQVEAEIKSINATLYLKSTRDFQADYLFLLPSLISRVEYTLLHFCLEKRLLLQDTLRIGIVEQDLACAELSMITFLDRISKLVLLYNLPITLPRVELFIERNKKHPPEINEKLAKLMLAHNIIATDVGIPSDLHPVLIIDTSIKFNGLLKSSLSAKSENIAEIRNIHRHRKQTTFSYLWAGTGDKSK